MLIVTIFRGTECAKDYPAIAFLKELCKHSCGTVYITE